MAVAPFTSVLEASNRAKTLLAGGFRLDGDDATEGTNQLVVAFNNYWDVAIHGLQMQLRFLFVNMFRVHQYEANQLGSGQPLQICGNIQQAKYKLEMEEMLPFTERIYGIKFDQVFSLPTIEAEETDAMKKRKRGRRLEAFEILKLAAFDKVRELDNEVTAEIEARYELYLALIGDLDVDRLLKSGTGGPSGAAVSQTSTSSKTGQYKPQETFLGSKKFPWWRTGDTTAAPDDLEKLSDYLFSGGTFTDIEQPVMYLKKCFDKETMISYRVAIDKHKVTKEAKDLTIELLIDTIREVIQSRIPRRSRLTQMLERAVSVGKMGKKAVI